MRHIQEGIDSSGLKYVRNNVSTDRGFLVVALHGYGKCMTHLFDLFLEFDDELPIVALQAPCRIGPGAYRWFGYQPGSSTDILEHEWGVHRNFKRPRQGLWRPWDPGADPDTVVAAA